MRPYLVFDVNETLLDLSALDPHFQAYFGDKRFRKDWFNQVLQSAFSSTILGSYHNFGLVARSALTMVANQNDISLEQDAYTSILGQMRQLPAHPDVLPGIIRLKEAGFQMSALTNSPYEVAKDQIDHAGLSEYMDSVLSVDASMALKPARAVYAYASQALDQEAHNLCLIAAHPWDIAGAMRSGWQGAFITRHDKAWNPLFEEPSYHGIDLLDIAIQLSEL
ncbi:MAG: haloacid dehalogenase type II [Rhodothermaceae bacterium]|nr:haloacid dehalogenase type II [Rhodothermaceae bacterium]